MQLITPVTLVTQSSLCSGATIAAAQAVPVAACRPQNCRAGRLPAPKAGTPAQRLLAEGALTPAASAAQQRRWRLPQRSPGRPPVRSSSGITHHTLSEWPCTQRHPSQVGMQRGCSGFRESPKKPLCAWCKPGAPCNPEACSQRGLPIAGWHRGIGAGASSGSAECSPRGMPTAWARR
jgi:hypothetical protein